MTTEGETRFDREEDEPRRATLRAFAEIFQHAREFERPPRHGDRAGDCLVAPPADAGLSRIPRAPWTVATGGHARVELVEEVEGGEGLEVGDDGSAGGGDARLETIDALGVCAACRQFAMYAS